VIPFAVGLLLPVRSRRWWFRTQIALKRDRRSRPRADCDRFDVTLTKDGRVRTYSAITAQELAELHAMGWGRVAPR
jgi:hypothetical protein